MRFCDQFPYGAYNCWKQSRSRSINYWPHTMDTPVMVFGILSLVWNWKRCCGKLWRQIKCSVSLTRLCISSLTICGTPSTADASILTYWLSTFVSSRWRVETGCSNTSGAPLRLWMWREWRSYTDNKNRVPVNLIDQALEYPCYIVQSESHVR